MHQRAIDAGDRYVVFPLARLLEEDNEDLVRDHKRAIELYERVLENEEDE